MGCFILVGKEISDFISVGKIMGVFMLVGKEMVGFISVEKEMRVFMDPRTSEAPISKEWIW